ncbi:hypothetical protein B0H10DRAFT_2042650 [Mycena sp. CBHHK59/15]|nr:hypothetical protein B0H10DRAFT_2042650 [Mycena sp. CBHHK59/15]
MRFTSPLTLIALLCLALPSFAAPVPTLDIDAADLAARGITGSKVAARPPTAQQMINGGMIDTPRTDKAFFWSGPNPQPAGLRRLRVVATDFAEKNDFDYVGSMLTAKGNAVINLIKNPGITAEFQEEFWDNASEAFAELTTGKVTVMLEGDPATGPPPPANLVFAKVEAPVLEQRKAAGLVSDVVRVGRDFATTKKSVSLKLPL